MANKRDENIEPKDESLQRLDKWLKVACIFKTRSQATRACDERRIRVNGQVAKASRLIKAGDELSVKLKGGKFLNLTIKDVSHKNISKKDARLLYDMHELELSEETKELIEFFHKAEKAQRIKYKGRPTKKERRRLEKFKQRFLPWS